MSKLVKSYGVRINRCTTYTAIEVKKGGKIIDAKWDNWGAQVFVLEDDNSDCNEKETKEVVVVATGYTVNTHDDSGRLVRVLEHVATIEPARGEHLHIFENTKR